MAVNNGVVSIPVTVKEVKELVGASAYDVGAVCTAKNINMWSKYKPIHYYNSGTEIATLTEAERIYAHHGIYFAGAYSDYDTYKNDVDNNVAQDKWKYEDPQEHTDYFYGRPYGGKNSPYRLADFIGYDHNATSPMVVETVESQTIEADDSESTVAVSCSCHIEDGTDAGVINLAEIMPTDHDYYYKIVAYFNGTKNSEYTAEEPCISDSKAYQENTSIAVKLPLNYGEWDFYHMLYCDETSEMLPFTNYNKTIVHIKQIFQSTIEQIGIAAGNDLAISVNYQERLDAIYYNLEDEVNLYGKGDVVIKMKLKANKDISWSSPEATITDSGTTLPYEDSYVFGSDGKLCTSIVKTKGDEFVLYLGFRYIFDSYSMSDGYNLQLAVELGAGRLDQRDFNNVYWHDDEDVYAEGTIIEIN